MKHKSDATQIEEWNAIVTRLKKERAHYRCEICGTNKRPIHGHHKRPPVDGDHSETNCIICCDDCYQAVVLSGTFRPSADTNHLEDIKQSRRIRERLKVNADYRAKHQRVSSMDIYQGTWRRWQRLIKEANVNHTPCEICHQPTSKTNPLKGYLKDNRKGYTKENCMLCHKKCYGQKHKGDNNHLPRITKDRIRLLEHLQDNWDSYGAKPISCEVIKSATSLLTHISSSFSLQLIESVSIIPCSDGGIQLEWALNSKDFIVKIAPNGKNLSFLLVLPSGDETEGDILSNTHLNDLLEELLKET